MRTYATHVLYEVSSSTTAAHTHVHIIPYTPRACKSTTEYKKRNTNSKKQTKTATITATTHACWHQQKRLHHIKHTWLRDGTTTRVHMNATGDVSRYKASPFETLLGMWCPLTPFPARLPETPSRLPSPRDFRGGCPPRAR